MRLSRPSRSLRASIAIVAVSGLLAACTTTDGASDKQADKDSNQAASKDIMVTATSQSLGYQKIGKPYQVKGNWYTPKANEKYSKVGLASWYGPNFNGGRTANGETYDMNHLSAAHKTLPLPCYVRVTNLENDTSVIVRVNDRGPFVSGRIIDLSKKAAEMLDMTHDGVAKVRVDYVGPARQDPSDMDYLLASYQKKADLPDGVDPERFGNGPVQVVQTEVNVDSAKKAENVPEEKPTLLAFAEEPKAETNVAIDVSTKADVPKNETASLLLDDMAFPKTAPIPLKR